MNRIVNKKEGKSVSFLIVEDHNALRVSLRDLLNAYFLNPIILEAKNGEEAVALVLEQHPDVVLMDFSMPGIKGIESIRRIKKEQPTTQVVVLSINENPEYRDAAAVAGASAFIPKQKLGTDLIPVMSDLLIRSTDGS